MFLHTDTWPSTLPCRANEYSTAGEFAALRYESMNLVIVLFVVAALLAADQALRNPAYFVVFLLAAGTLRFGTDLGEGNVAASDLSAVWLLCLIALSGVALLQSGAFDGKRSPPEIAYACFLAWCLFEALRADTGMFAWRVFLKLLYPLLVMILARNGGSSLPIAEFALKRTLAATAIVFVFVGGFTCRFAGSLVALYAPLFWAYAAFADHAAILTLLALSCWRLTKTPRYLALSVALGTSSVFNLTRTGVCATAVGVSIFALLEWWHRALPFILVAFLGGMVALVTVPEFRNRMFHDSKGSAAANNSNAVGLSNIDSSGRFSLWERVLNKFFWPNPLVGSGLGSTQQYLYNSPNEPVKVEHSEYVRLLSDVGIIGLGLYLAALFTAMASAWRVYRSAPSSLARYFAMAAFSSIPAYLVCMGFDNVLNYVLAAGQYPLAFSGIAIGLGERRTLVPGVVSGNVVF